MKTFICALLEIVSTAVILGALAGCIALEAWVAPATPRR